MAQTSKFGWLAFLFGLPVVAGVSTGVATDSILLAILAIVAGAIVAVAIMAKFAPDVAGL